MKRQLPSQTLEEQFLNPALPALLSRQGHWPLVLPVPSRRLWLNFPYRAPAEVCLSRASLPCF
jgi:hypothetical protein